jgi:hypothetical protein
MTRNPPPDARSAQTPVEPPAGARPGEPDPFAPPPAPRPAPRRAASRPQASPLPLSGPRFETTVLLGVTLTAGGLAGLALSRTRRPAF